MRACAGAACLLFAYVHAVPTAVAQTSSNNELSQYTSAVAQVRSEDRLVQLELFVMRATPGPLKTDALELVIWHYLQVGRVSHALAWADTLAANDKDNPIATALLSNRARSELDQGTIKPQHLLAMSSRGLDRLPQLARPLGMSPADFVLLERQANAMLSGAAGAAELRLRDDVAARVYLHNAVAVQPSNVADVYALALADLNGHDPNRKEGYWYLARAVDLSRGTPQGIEIARFARARYVQDGGSTSNWDQFLSAAARPNPNAERATEMEIASANVPHPAPQPSPPTKVAQPPTRVATNRSTIAKPSASQPAPSIWADNANPTQPIVRRHIPATTGPMSLGILVETSLTNKENRAAVVNSLIDMLRRMNDRDEAFILTYDNNLVFAEDLTNDPQQLEQALESIKPQKGAVLDDAIAFAAGHLARIAKYPNRVLLVVSDGRNIDSHASPVQTSAEINAAGVRIYCIGVDVSESYGRYRLQALASSTGGQSSFINGPGQFRKATEVMAQNMGIDFRF